MLHISTSCNYDITLKSTITILIINSFVLRFYVAPTLTIFYFLQCTAQRMNTTRWLFCIYHILEYFNQRKWKNFLYPLSFVKKKRVATTKTFECLMHFPVKQQHCCERNKSWSLDRPALSIWSFKLCHAFKPEKLRNFSQSNNGTKSFELIPPCNATQNIP